MNSVNKLFCIFLISGIFVALNSKSVEFVYEDAYLKQAPAEIVTRVDHAAEVVGFKEPFEVTVPTKAGIQINPINGFIAFSRNPLSKQVLFIVNPEWFSTLMEDEQTFMFGYNFMRTVPGFLYYVLKVLPYLFVLLSILLAFLIYWAISFTPLAHKKWWIKAVATYVLLVCINLLIIKPFVHPKVTQFLGRTFDMNVIDSVVQKTNNKQAAIQSLEKYNAGIQDLFDKGESSLEPYVGLFQRYADKLKNS